MKNKRVIERLTNNWPAKILSIVAAILLFLFYRISTLQERYISVPLHVVTNDAFVPAAPLPDSVRITLRGKADTIFLVHEEDVDAFVDLSPFKAAGDYKVPVKINRKGEASGSDIEIKVDPLDLTVTLEKKASKSISVYPNIKGFPAKGYELGQYFLTPDQVEIAGPESKVQDIDSLTTDAVDLTGKTQDFTDRIGITISDPTIHIVGTPEVEFHGVIQQITLTKVISPVDVVALDLDPSFHMSTDFRTGEIRVQGSQLDLEALRPGDVTLDVECSQIRTSGVYTLSTKPSVPRGLTVLSYDPEKVTLTVTRGGQ